MATRTDQVTIEAAAFADDMNLLLQVSVLGYAEFALKCGGGTTALLLERVARMRRTLARVKNSTAPDLRRAEETLAELALLLDQSPLDVSAVERCVTAFGRLIGVLPAPQSDDA